MPNAPLEAYEILDFYSGEIVSVMTLDEGVREVVCTLIDLGAIPVASCDGHEHPEWWYVYFHAPVEVAQEVADREWFEVKLNASDDNDPEWLDDHWSSQPEEPGWYAWNLGVSRVTRGGSVSAETLRTCLDGWLTGIDEHAFWEERFMHEELRREAAEFYPDA